MADVYAISMKQADRLSLTLNGDDVVHYMWVAVYASDAMSIKNTSALVETYSWVTYPKRCTFNAASSGTYYVAVQYPVVLGDTSQCFGNYSLAWTCQSPTITSLTTRSKTVRKGSSVKVAGSVKHDVDSAAVVGQSVELQKSKNGKGGWKKVTSKATDANGAFSFKVKPGKTTWYRVSSPKTASLLKSTSTIVKIKVR